MTLVSPRAYASLAALLVLSTHAPAQTPGTAYEVISSMGAAELFGSGPVAPLLEGSDGAWYGSTRSGGLGNGTIFKINKDGSGYRVLHLFGAVLQDGGRPYASLIKGSDGLLYGTAETGGISSDGTLFRIAEDGRNFRVVRHFASATGAARGALLIGDDGAFYSTTAAGGLSNRGVIYRIEQDGSEYRVLHHFGTNLVDGRTPEAGMIRASDGKLYGVTYLGGTGSYGTVFCIGQNGSGYSILRHFNGDPGALKAGVLEASDGFLYGTGELDANDDGALFRLRKDGTSFEVLHSFATGNGRIPWGDLIEGSDGAIYGTTYGAGLPGSSAIFKYRRDTSTYLEMYNFPGIAGLHCGLRRGSDGLLYGTSEGGGTYVRGTLFRIEESGSNFTKLVDFGAPNVGGHMPRSSPLAASDGQLYGTTEIGGRSNVGAIYGIDVEGNNPRLLKHFGDPADGRTPNGIMEATDGFLYGTTQIGGAAGQGILYRIAKSGSSYTNLRSFAVGILSTDGKSPRSTLVESMDGYLYGTTFFGGTSNRGTIFRIGKDGSNYVTICSFLVVSNGTGPRDLIEASDNMLYGITTTGGITNRGTVYRCSRDGTVFDVLHRFEGATDGHAPEGGLLEGSDGYLYGTTAGNSTNRGTIFRLQKNGSDYAVVWRFMAGVNDGRNPKGRLIEDLQGDLIGTTSAGGLGIGTIFKIGKDGAHYEELWQFGSITPDALRSVAGVVRASSGIYYGVGEGGGTTGGGAVFRFDPQRVALSITRQGATAILEWPASTTLDQLQSQAISSSTWMQVKEPVFDVGGRFRATVPNASEPERFFRVRRSWH
jgi:uncharacterized repeat protein (TIGR03803 family)